MRRHIAAGVLAALCVGLAVGVVNVQVASAQPLTSAVTGVADEQSVTVLGARRDRQRACTLSAADPGRHRLPQ